MEGSFVVQNQAEGQTLGSDEHIQEMIAKAEGMNQQGEPQVEESPKEDVPKLLAGKYKSVDDLEKGYKELEKKLGSKIPPQQQQEEVDQQAKEVVNNTGLSFDSFSQEFFDTGSLSEKSYSELESKGLSRALVDQYITGYRASQQLAEAQAQKTVQEIETAGYSVTGGKESYEAMTAWATESMSNAEINAFNKVIESNDPEQIKLAISGVYSRYQREAGIPPKNLIAGYGSSGNIDAYESMQQMTKDMADPRYKIDPAYQRMVYAKAARSNF